VCGSSAASRECLDLPCRREGQVDFDGLRLLGRRHQLIEPSLVELGDSAGDSVVDALGSIAASECGAVSQEVQHVDQDVAVVLVPVDLVDRLLPGREGRHAHTDWTAPGDRREHACVDPGPDGWRRDAQDVSGVRDLRPGGSVSDMVSEAEKAPAPRCIAFLRCELLELDQSWTR